MHLLVQFPSDEARHAAELLLARKVAVGTANWHGRQIALPLNLVDELVENGVPHTVVGPAPISDSDTRIWNPPEASLSSVVTIRRFTPNDIDFATDLARKWQANVASIDWSFA